MNNHFDVVIVGGGPTGIALGIELGMHNVKTLILEKHDQPLLSPRAQSLNERSMEFFIRWGLLDKMKEQVLFPSDYPMRGVWCSKLNGTTYATASSADQFSTPATAAPALRIPLYITENILRDRLSKYKSVTFLKNNEATQLEIQHEQVIVKAKSKKDGVTSHYSGAFVIGCDGANSMVRQSLNIPFKELAPKRRVINLLFEAPGLQEKITVEKGFLYYLLENKTVAAMGPVNLYKHIWYAQIVYQGEEKSIDDINVSSLLDEVSGITFKKTIINKHFWDMQIKLADQYSQDNRVFLLGDAAHAFAPTGGLGLNTGLGDVTNLAWKLAAIINQSASLDFLNTYEEERRAIAIRNLNAAEKNAADAIATKQKFPPSENPEGFAKENARIAKQHVQASGITLGYTYDKNEPPMEQSKYQPTCKPGYFLPFKSIQGKAIYEKLSPTHWTLIICGKEKVKFTHLSLKFLHVPEATYPSRYILIRPDWHIAQACQHISQDDILKQEGFY